jgi:hypothetical protein
LPELSAAPLQADQAGSGIVLEIGASTSGFEARSQFLNLSDTRLNQLNIGVVGDLGTGKTQLLKALILQVTNAAEANRGIKPRFLIFDYKKDYSSPDFVQAVGAKVIKPHRMPLNLFDTTGMVDSMVPWLDRFKFFADVLDKIFSGIGPVQRDKLKQAVKKAYEAAESQGRMPTLNDVHAEYRLIRWPSSTIWSTRRSSRRIRQRGHRLEASSMASWWCRWLPWGKTTEARTWLSH